MMQTKGKGIAFITSMILLIATGLAGPLAAQTTVSITRTVGGDGSYLAGSTLDVTITFLKSGSESITQLGLTETLPTGWTFESNVSGSIPEISPAQGESGIISFGYFVLPVTYPVSFTYRVAIPSGSTGNVTLLGHGIYAVGEGSTVQTDTVSTPISYGGADEGEIEGEGTEEGEGVTEGEMEDGVFLARTVGGDGAYHPGTTLDITVTLTRTGSGTLTQLGLVELIPSGWSFRRLVDGAIPSVAPPSGTTGTLGFAWISIPTFPVTFTYRVNVPSSSTGDKTITGHAIYAFSESQMNSPDTATVISEGTAGEGEGDEEGETEGAVEGMELTRRIPSGGYEPGTAMTVEITLRYTEADAVTSLALEETLPSGWTFNSLISGSIPNMGPSSGASGTLTFLWVAIPAFPMTFRYRVNVPPDASGTYQLYGFARYRTSGDEIVSNQAVTYVTEGLTEGEEEGEGEVTIEGEEEGESPYDLTVSQTPVSGYSYVPGGTVDMRIRFTYKGVEAVTALALVETLPVGWTFNKLVSGAIPSLAPASGAEGDLEFAWIMVPAFPATFTYRVNVPANATGPQAISGAASYRTSGLELASNTAYTVLSEHAKADLAVQETSVPSKGWISGYMNISWTAKNTGGYNATAPWNDGVYLSADNTVGNDTRLGTTEHLSDLVVEASYTETRKVLIPVIPAGEYWIITNVDDGGAVPEDNESNNIQITGPIPFDTIKYAATVSAVPDSTLNGEPVPLTGRATFLNSGASAPNVDVVVEITHNDVTRYLDVQTDGTGYFSLEFQPLDTEAGTYSIGARHPGLESAPVQDTFTILGLIVPQPSRALELVSGVPQDVSVDVVNLGGIPLTGLQATITGAPANVSITPDIDSSLPGDGTAVLTLTVLAEDNSTLTGTVTVTITSTEGASTTVQLNLSMLSSTLSLQPDSSVLQAGARRNAETMFVFNVTNRSDTPATNFRVEPPVNTPWISVAAPPSGITVAPGQTVPVTLQMTPDTSTAVQEVQTNIRLLAGTSWTLSVPLRVNVTDAARGNLEITVTDELTVTEASKPTVSNARVVLWNPATGAPVTSTISGLTGKANFTDIAAGAYNVEVYSGNHGMFSTAVEVQAGRTLKTQVQLHRNFVRQQWSVVSTSDAAPPTYAVSTAVESGRQAAMITIEPPVLDLSNMSAPSMQTEITIRNQGLLPAHGVQLSLGAHPRYTFTPLLNIVGVLEPGETVHLPILVEDSGGNPGTECTLYEPSGLLYAWDVNGTGEWRMEPIAVRFPSANCQASPPLYGDSYTLFRDRAPYVCLPSFELTWNCGTPIDTCATAEIMTGADLALPLTGVETTLTMHSTNAPLTNIKVDLNIQDEEGNDATPLFVVYPIEYTGITGISGEGVLASGASATVRWRIIPLLEAGSGSPTRYTIGGQWSFTRSGSAEALSLVPAALTVYPTPGMDLHVFYPATVYADDPLTPESETPESFPAGLLLYNFGGGTAQDVSIFSARPELPALDGNPFGLFHILEAFAGATAVPAALGMTLGDIGSGSAALAYWHMNSPVGASFDSLNPMISLNDARGLNRAIPLAEGTMHDLVHIVNVNLPSGDGLPDFLVNDTPDAENMPDFIYMGTGDSAVVTPAQNVVLTSVKQVFMSYSLTATVSPGWTYVRVPNPAGADYAVLSITRSDSLAVSPDNIWLTRRTVRDASNQPVAENLLHFLDFQSTGRYTVLFKNKLQENTPPVANAGEDQTSYLGAQVTLNGSGSSDVDAQALTYTWSLVSKPEGSAATLSSTTSVSPKFLADKRGAYVAQLVVNDGFASSAPDTVTVEVRNRLPVANAGTGQTRALGQTVSVNGAGSSDPDGDPLTYAWSFVSVPAGSAAVLTTPANVTTSFTLDVPGSFVLQLVVNDGFDDSLPGTVTIKTNNIAPKANAGEDTSARVGDTVSLDGRGSSDPDGDALSYQWMFVSRPTGSAAVLRNAATATPDFTLDKSGTYIAQLTVNDGVLNSVPDTVTIGTANTPPVADAGPDQSAKVGDTVYLDGTASFDADNNALSYSWTIASQPSGSTASLMAAVSSKPSIQLDRAGVYVIQLVVNDGKAPSVPDEMVITTLNSAPVADAGPGQFTQIGQTVQLDGSGSSDMDDDALTYAWTFISKPSGSTAALSNPSAVNPTFPVDKEGTYVVQLVVNDGTENSAPDSVSISTENAPPTANAGPDQRASVATNVMLDGSGSSDPEAAPLTYAWSFTSRPAGSTATLTGASTVSPGFFVDRAGTYVIRLIVNDGQLNSAPDTVTISTLNSAPVANAGPDQTSTVGTLVTLDGSKSSDVDNDTLTFSWAFASKPAGSTAALNNPNTVHPAFTLDVEGVYVVQLIVNDGLVNSAPATVTIRTANTPPTPEPGENQTGTVGETVCLDGTASSDPDNDEITYAWSFTSLPANSTAALDDATSPTPCFTIDVEGKYQVQLIVSDGVNVSAPAYVMISTGNSAPVAIAGPDQTTMAGSLVTLDGSGSYDADGDPLTYAWSFTSMPPASTAVLTGATTVNPHFTVDVGGTYVVQLLVTDGEEFSTPDTVTISTGNAAPVANAGPDQTRLVGQLTWLDGRGSSDADGDALTYDWSFTSRPAGSTVTLSDTKSATPNFRLDVKGTYVLQLVVNDGKMNSAPDTTIISTVNSKPAANAGLDQSVTVGQLVRLDGRLSADPDGETITYQWSFMAKPSGSVASLNNSALQQPAFTADKEGLYVMQLVVNDGELSSDPDTVNIYAGNATPDCPNPPAAPENVAASDGTYSDYIMVTWNTVSGAADYRVWRGESNDVASATAVSDWIVAPIYNDVTALAAEVPKGCNGADNATYHYYYYWVEARKTEKCKGDLGGGDQGYRGVSSAKSAFFASTFPIPVLPNTTEDGVVRLIHPDSMLALRLQSNEDIESVWGEVRANTWSDSTVTWRPVEASSARSGWVVYEPQFSWTAGESVFMTAGGRTVSGAALEQVAYRFEVLPDAGPGKAIEQPGYDAFDSSRLNPDAESNDTVKVLEVPQTPSAVLSNPLTPVYEIAPMIPFETPQRVWIPLPKGVPPEAAQLWYFVDDREGGQWYPAKRIEGWLCPNTLMPLELNGITYIGAVVTHGGTVQLATGPATDSASVISIPANLLGDILMSILMLAAFGFFARHRRIRG